jgi:hypothetical protein
MHAAIACTANLPQRPETAAVTAATSTRPRVPVSRCQVCQRIIASRAGQASAVLTKHYRREHPGVLAAASERPA